MKKLLLNLLNILKIFISVMATTVLQLAVLAPVTAIITFTYIIYLSLGKPQKLRSTYVRISEYAYIQWNKFNRLWLKHSLGIKVNFPPTDEFSKDDAYIITANHQSYLDILILQIFCMAHLPPPKFLLKDKLIYLPLIGIACWGLEFIFSKRYSRKTLKKKPQLLLKNNEKISRQCQRLAQQPLSMVIFAEGTRLTAKKKENQKNAYRHLLSPQAVGLSTMIYNFYPKTKKLIDISIVYDNNQPSLWKIFTKEITTITVSYKIYDLSEDLVGNYQKDKTFRKHFRSWVNGIWLHKDRTIDKLKDKYHIK